MKLQKIIAVLGISACLVGTEVLAFPVDTVAVEGYSEADTEKLAAAVKAIAAQKGLAVGAQIDLNCVNVGALIQAGLNLEAIDLEAARQGNVNLAGVNLNAISPDALGIASAAPEAGAEEAAGTETGVEEAVGTETGGEEAVGTETGGAETGGTETGGSEAGGTETGGEETDGSETGGAEAGDTETDSTETGDTGAESAESGSAGTGSSKGQASGSSGAGGQVSGSQTGSAQGSLAAASAESGIENNLGDIFGLGEFEPSSKFLDDEEKVKYSVDIPLEGIPSFITQEMIVGALKCQDEEGYPASVTIAQIIQESGYGAYGPGGDDGEGLSYLAFQFNNLFGIKGTGTAGSVSMMTGEQTESGASYTTRAGFRVYNTYTECIEDRAELLEESYSDLTEGVEDANTFAVKIGKRWATGVNYGQSLVRTMERYDLYRLDEMTLDEFSDMLSVFVNPCPGATLTSSFGSRAEPVAGAGTSHKGIDLGTGAYNIPTYAAAAGEVTFAGEAGTAGNMVVIDHGNGLVTKYMHHEKLYVKAGDKVEKGQQIGLSGTTGQSTGNHLHFQVEENGKAVDPMDYLGQGGSSEKISAETAEAEVSQVHNVMSQLRRKAMRKFLLTKYNK